MNLYQVTQKTLSDGVFQEEKNSVVHFPFSSLDTHFVFLSFPPLPNTLRSNYPTAKILISGVHIQTHYKDKPPICSVLMASTEW